MAVMRSVKSCAHIIGLSPCSGSGSLSNTVHARKSAAASWENCALNFPPFFEEQIIMTSRSTLTSTVGEFPAWTKHQPKRVGRRAGAQGIGQARIGVLHGAKVIGLHTSRRLHSHSDSSFSAAGLPLVARLTTLFTISSGALVSSSLVHCKSLKISSLSITLSLR